MAKKILKLSVSDARKKLTKLEEIVGPGEFVQITRRGKAYARIELAGDRDPYEEVLKSIESLPEPDEPLQTVAGNYKKLLYGREDEHPQGI
jgi:antitoxin (DNA-binding transcriptional repressor) of toxin-antitoxin stability system